MVGEVVALAYLLVMGRAPTVSESIFRSAAADRASPPVRGVTPRVRGVTPRAEGYPARALDDGRWPQLDFCL